jgi:D-alanyl-D-alanine carboxypeptidase
VTVIAKPAALDVIVNKQRLLPADYVPTDLVEPKVRFPYTEKLEKRKLRKEAAAALTEMFDAAEQEGIILYAVSGYRSYQTQKSLYASYVKRDGEAAAARYSAKPGTSEHQTGLTMDVSSESNNFQLTQAFGTTKEGKWLAKHSWEYGFIIRYQQETEDITGYMYEPWHIRFIGKPTAKDVFEQSVTLEEYYNLAVPVAG